MTPTLVPSSVRTSRSSSKMRGNNAIGLLLLLAGRLSAGEPVDLYIPFVRATIESTTFPDGTGELLRWESIVGANNTSNVAATLTAVGLYGNGAALGEVTECGRTISIDSRTGENVLVRCVLQYPSPGVAMFRLRTPPGVLVAAEVQKVRIRYGCNGLLSSTPIPMGQATLPVFRGLFPTGATAVSGPVELGTFTLPLTCAPASQQYRRRVNVTLFNGSISTARMRFWETPNHFSSDAIYSREVTLGPMEIIQINSIPVPTEPDMTFHAVNGGERIWIHVTSDQPFLSYASTVFDNPEPGALPFQVYPGMLAE